MRHFLAQQTVNRVAVSLACIALVVEDHRYALVRGLEYGLRLRDHAE